MTTRSRRLLPSLLAPLGCAVLLSAAPAEAAAGSIAVLGLEAVDASEADASRLTDALRQRLAGAPGIRVVPGKDYVEMKLVFDCMDDTRVAACMAQAGRSLGADKLVFGTLKGTRRGGRLSLSLRLLDVRSATLVKTLPPEALAPADLAPSGVGALASRLLAALLGIETRTALTITSDPAGAEVTIDGLSRGVTPLTVADLAPGTHQVALALAGRATVRQAVTLQPGEAAKLDLALQSFAGGGAPPQAGPTTSSGAEHPGRAATVLGGTALVAAAVLGGVALYTWRRYSSLEDDTTGTLKTVQRDDPDYARANRDWFATRGSSCSFPSGAPKSTQADLYRRQCNDGNTYAGVTTGLVVGAGVLAGAGLVALIVGLRAGSARDRPPATSLVPRLRALTPVVSASGGGISASFEF